MTKKPESYIVTEVFLRSTAFITVRGSLLDLWAKLEEAKQLGRDFIAVQFYRAHNPAEPFVEGILRTDQIVSAVKESEETPAVPAPPVPVPRESKFEPSDHVPYNPMNLSPEDLKALQGKRKK